jgi:hypothetical protein
MTGRAHHVTSSTPTRSSAPDREQHRHHARDRFCLSQWPCRAHAADKTMHQTPALMQTLCTATVCHKAVPAAAALLARTIMTPCSISSLHAMFQLLASRFWRESIRKIFREPLAAITYQPGENAAGLF